MKKNPLLPKIPSMPRKPRLPKAPMPNVPAPMNGPTQAPPDLGASMPQAVPPSPISQGKIQLGGFKPKKGGMF